MSRLTAVYPGTFDPVTNGHLDIIIRASRIFPHLIIGVAGNDAKGPLFSIEERVLLLKDNTLKIAAKTGHQIEVQPFTELLLDFAVKQNAKVIIRGLRVVSDFDYEFQLTGINYRINPDIETLFLMAGETQQFISSRFVKEVARFRGDTSGFVPENVQNKLVLRFGGQHKSRA